MQLVLESAVQAARPPRRFLEGFRGQNETKLHLRQLLELFAEGGGDLMDLEALKDVFHKLKRSSMMQADYQGRKVGWHVSRAIVVLGASLIDDLLGDLSFEERSLDIHRLPAVAGKSWSEHDKELLRRYKALVRDQRLRGESSTTLAVLAHLEISRRDLFEFCRLCTVTVADLAEDTKYAPVLENLSFYLRLAQQGVPMVESILSMALDEQARLRTLSPAEVDVLVRAREVQLEVRAVAADAAASSARSASAAASAAVVAPRPMLAVARGTAPFSVKKIQLPGGGVGAVAYRSSPSIPSQAEGAFSPPASSTATTVTSSAPPYR